MRRGKIEIVHLLMEESDVDLKIFEDPGHDDFLLSPIYGEHAHSYLWMFCLMLPYSLPDSRRSPIRELNASFNIIEDEGNSSVFMRMIIKSLEKQDDRILVYLLRVLHACDLASEIHSSEALDIADVRKKIELVISEIFAGNAFDDEKKVLMLLQAEDCTSILSSPNSAILYCLEKNIKVLFDKARVNQLMMKLFYEPTELVDTGDNDELMKKMLSLRALPFAVMLAELASKLAILWCLVSVAVYEYGASFQLDYCPVRDYEFSSYEYALAVLVLSDGLYEIGEVLAGQSSVLVNPIPIILEHNESEWNRIDFSVDVDAVNMVCASILL
jgi:hypothetical protein